jgi:hypothetical protein
MKKTPILIALLAFILVGCSGQACSQGDACQYYQGTEGVRMEPVDLPTELYYHGDEPKEQNFAEFPVRVRNLGASNTYGATFLTGLDPETFDLYYIDEGGSKVPFNIARTGACRLGLNGFSFFNPGRDGPSFNLGLNGDCGNFFLRSTSGGFQAGASVDTLFGPVFEDLGIDAPPADLTVDVSDGNIDVGFGVSGALIDVWRHGTVLIGIASKFSLENFNGNTYILAGQNPETPSGGEAYTSFRAEMRNWPAGTDRLNLNYIVKNCYAYTTFVSPSVCIDQDPRRNEDQVCPSDQVISAGSQGGPVAVTRIEQENTGPDLILRFTVQNVGNGEVFNVGYMQACSPYYPGRQPTGSFKGVVHIGQAYIGNNALDCNTNQVTLRNGRAQFTCQYSLDGEGIVSSAYERPLKMELWYGYENQIRRSLNVRRIG